MSNTKRILAVLCTIAMLFSNVIPTSGFAYAGGDRTDYTETAGAPEDSLNTVNPVSASPEGEAVEAEEEAQIIKEEDPPAASVSEEQAADSSLPVEESGQASREETEKADSALVDGGNQQEEQTADEPSPETETGDTGSSEDDPSEDAEGADDSPAQKSEPGNPAQEEPGAKSGDQAGPADADQPDEGSPTEPRVIEAGDEVWTHMEDEETFLLTVPAEKKYGLVIFSRNSFRISIQKYDESVKEWKGIQEEDVHRCYELLDEGDYTIRLAYATVRVDIRVMTEEEYQSWLVSRMDPENADEKAEESGKEESDGQQASAEKTEAAEQGDNQDQKDDQEQVTVVSGEDGPDAEPADAEIIEETVEDNNTDRSLETEPAAEEETATEASNEEDESENDGTQDEVTPEETAEAEPEEEGIEAESDGEKTEKDTQEETTSEETENPEGTSETEIKVEEEEEPAEELIVLTENDFSVGQLSAEDTDALVTKYLPEPAAESGSAKRTMRKTRSAVATLNHTGYLAFDIDLKNPELKAETYEVPVSLENPVLLTAENEAIDNVSLELYHIVEDGAEKVDLVSESIENSSLTGFTFRTGGFSNYVLKYTVEFHYLGVDYSVEGNSQILLSELIIELNIMNGDALLDVADVAYVSFSNKHLVKVEEVSGLITYNGAENVDVGEIDFLLSSELPFTSQEKLTITLKNGDAIEIGVTDAQYWVYLTEGVKEFSLKTYFESQSSLGLDTFNSIISDEECYVYFFNSSDQYCYDYSYSLTGSDIIITLLDHITPGDYISISFYSFTDSLWVEDKNGSYIDIIFIAPKNTLEYSDGTFTYEIDKNGNKVVVTGLDSTVSDKENLNIPASLSYIFDGDAEPTLIPVTAIEAGAFKGLSGLNLTVKGDIEVRGSYVNDSTGSTGAFGYISDSTVTFEGNVVLKGSAFQGASNLTVKATGTGTMDLGQKAFAFVSNLNLSVGSGTKITGSAYNVFQSASGELEFLGGVESIGEYSFISSNISKLKTTTKDTYSWYDYGLSNLSKTTDVLLKAGQGKQAKWSDWPFVKSLTVDYDSYEEYPAACASLGNNGAVPVIINYNGGVGQFSSDVFRYLKGASGSQINVMGDSVTVKQNAFPDDENLTVNFDMFRDAVSGVEYNDALTKTTFIYKASDYRKEGEEQILLSSLIADMDITLEDGTAIDLSQVASVQFQEHDVTVTKVQGIIYYNEAGDTAVDIGKADFLLTSTAAFTNEEKICIILTDGTRITRNWTSQADKYNINGNETLKLSDILKATGNENVFEAIGESSYAGLYDILWRVVDSEGQTIQQSYAYYGEYYSTPYDAEITDLDQIPYQSYGGLYIYQWGKDETNKGWVTFSSGYKFIYLIQNEKPVVTMTDGIFLYKVQDGKAEIVKLVDTYEGDGIITVPATVELPDPDSEEEDAKKTYPVVAIRDMAFYNDNRLKELTFADAEGAEPLLLETSSVFYAPALTKISGDRKVMGPASGAAAITNNDLLTDVTLHIAAGSKLKNVLGYSTAVENAELYLDANKLKIDWDTFSLYGLKNLTIHVNNIDLGMGLSGTNGLETLTFDCDTPMTISAYALNNLTALKTVTIPGGVTSIGREAFAGDTALTTVTLGTDGDNKENSLQIAIDAFKDCTALNSKVTCTQEVISKDGTVTVAATETGVPLGAMLVVEDTEENSTILDAAHSWYSTNGYNYPIDAIVYKEISLVSPAGDKVTGVAADVLMSNTADNRITVGHANAFDRGTLQVFHLTDPETGTVEHIETTDQLIYADGQIQKLAFHVDSMSPFGLTVLSNVYHDDMFWYTLDSSNPDAVKAIITGVYDGDPENPVTDLVFTGKTQDDNKYTVIGIEPGALNGITDAAYSEKTEAAIAANKAVKTITFTNDGIKNTLTKTSSGYETPEDLFNGITGLESVTFGDAEDANIGSPLRLMTRAFYDCTALKNFTSHINEVYVQSTAFGGCSALETVIFDGNGTQKIVNSAFSSATDIKYLRIDNPYNVENYAFSVSNGTAFVQNNDSPLNGNMATKIGKFDTYVFAGIPWWVGDGLKGDVAQTIYFANGNLPGKDGFISMIRNAGSRLKDVYMDFDREDVSFADELDAANANVKIHYHNNAETLGFYLDGVNGNDETGDGSYEKPFRTFGKLAAEWANLTVDENAEPTVKTDTAITETVNTAMDTVSVNKEAGTFQTSITREKIAYIKNTVTISEEETWNSDADDPIVLNRDPNFKGIMVQNNSTLTLQNVVLDGGGEAGVAATAPIINSKAVLNIQDGAVIRNNKRTEFGYPDKAGGIYASGLVTMDGGEISGNTGAYGGGIQICGNRSVFNMSGGKIQNNTTVASKESYGGGVNVGSGATMYLSGGLISGNTAHGIGSAVGGAGGGIAIGADVSGMCQGARLVMSGGTVDVDGNESDQSGGGIFIQTNCTATITAGRITNNTAHGGAYGGGGIYANGVRDDTDDGRLYLNNVLITGNSADETGGGYAGCATSTTYIYMGNGAALYGNSAGDNSDFHIGTEQHLTSWGWQSGTPSAFVSQYMFNGTEYHWRNVETGEELTAAELARISTTTSMRANPDGTLPSTAAVIITGNHSDTKAGGIGSNGFVSIGDVPEPNDVKWKPSANKILYNRDMKEGEEFTFTVYEEKASQGQNFWWTRYNDVKVGTGSVTGGKDGASQAINFTEIDLGEKSSDNVGEVHTYLVVEDDKDDDLIHPDYYLAFNVIIGEKLDKEANKIVYCAELKSVERGRIVNGEFEYDNIFSDGTVSANANAQENFGRIRIKAENTTFVNTDTTTVVKVVKKWMDETGKEISAPEGATVTLQLYADGKTSVRRQGYTDPVVLKPITLDGEWDYDGEDNAWMAVWDYPRLPIYRLDNNGQMYRSAESGDDYERVVYTVREIDNSANLEFAPASPDVTLEYKYDEYHIAGRLDENGYEKRFMYTGEAINGQGALEISKNVKVSRDGATVDAESEDIKSKDYFIEVFTVIGDTTYYVTVNEDGKAILTDTRPEGENRLKVTMKEKLTLSPLPCGTYTVEEISTDDELAIGGMTLISAESVTVNSAITVEPGENANAGLENVYGNSRYCVAVTKQWDDDGNRDGVRPAALYVELYRDGERQIVGKDAQGKSLDYLTLNAANNWTGMVRGVELFDPDTGKYHEYTWKEFIFGGEDGTTRIYPDEDGKITFTVNGRKGNYTVSNDGVDEFENEDLGTITFITRLTNRHVPETMKVTARKVWHNEDGFTGLRKTIRLRLEGFVEAQDNISADAPAESGDSAVQGTHRITTDRITDPEKEINEDGIAEWTGLPVYKDGRPITYTVTEVEVPEGYEVEYFSGTEANNKTDGTVVNGNITVTNKLRKGNLLITKTMFVNDDRVENEEGTKDTVKAVYEAQKNRAFYVKISTKTGNDTWYVTRDSGLLKKDLTAADRIIWTVTMDKPLQILGLPVGEYTVTEVTETGEELNSTNGKIGSMTFIPMLSRITEAVQVEEGEEPADTVEANLVNKYTTGKYCIAVTKQWLVDGHAYTDDSLSVTVALQRTTTPDDESSYTTVQRAKSDGEGTEDYTLILNKANNWSAMALGQEQMDASGNRYSYRWIEVASSIPEGWKQGETSVPQKMELDGTLLIFLTKLTNNMNLTSVSVQKIWNDNNDQDGLRPDEIIVELMADAKPIDQAVLNLTNKWSHTFEKLPTRKNGHEIIYAVREINVPAGYDVSYESGKDESKKTDGTVVMPEGKVNVTNSHTPGTIDVKAKKVWKDNNNQDGKRGPVTLVLSGKYSVTDSEGNTSEKTVTVANAEKTIDNLTDDEQEVIWTGLTEKQEGQTVIYSVTEKGTTEGTGDHVGKTVITLNGAVYEVSIDGLSVTNTYTPETTETTVRKVWEDNNNHDGKRPETLSVVLTKTVGTGEDATSTETTYTLSAANEWSLTLNDLPTHEGGKAVSYSWSEPEANVPAGYTLTSTATEGTVTTITNTHVDETTESSVEKLWEDNNNTLGLRPKTITVKLYADNAATTTSITLPQKDSEGKTVWTYTAKDLTKYNAKGDEIAYSWMEDTTTLSNGYYLKSVNTEKNTGKDGSTSTKTTITNKYDPESVTRTVVKRWEDNADSEGFRPEFITVKLFKGEGKDKTQVGNDYILNAANNWSVTTEPLPKHENGKVINYYFEEALEADVAEKYTVSSETEGTTTIFTNTHTPETTSTTVTKVWKDSSNRDGIRPDHIDLKLYRKVGTAEKTLLKTVRISGAENTWTYTENNLPKYENGTEIVYSWEEYDQYDGYTGKQEGNTITNTHTPELIDIPVQKIWDDENDQDGLRPEKVHIILLADGTKTEETDVKGTAWTHTFKDLPKYRTGKVGEEIVYTITEETVNGYTTEIDGFTVTNRYVPEATETTVRKVWDDNNNHDGKRPETLSVVLTKTVGTGEDATSTETTYTLSAANEWSLTLNDLPTHEGGKAVSYSWSEPEANVPAGYTPKSTATEGTVTTITNAHVDETTESSVEKLWEDNNNTLGLRPETITLKLYADNAATTTSITLPQKDSEGKTVWTYTAKDLTKYNVKGDEIAYSWLEETSTLTNGYYLKSVDTSKVLNKDTGATSTKTTITNRYDPEYVTRTAVKRWEDNADSEGFRPASITVKLFKGEGKDKTQVGDDYILNAANNWSVTTEPLPKHENGEIINYYFDEVLESNIADKYTVSSETEGTTTIFTNTHKTKSTQTTVTKIWDDESNRDGIRPDHIDLKLYRKVGTSEKTLLKMVRISGIDDTWTYTESNLPMYEKGVEIVYSWEEYDEYIGYEGKQDGNTITNTHTPGKTEITVKKVWDDAEDQEGLRPEKVHIILLADGTKAAEADVEGTVWTHTFRDLPKYRTGKVGEEIVYTVMEDEVEGYNASVDGFTVTNRHELQKQNTKVVKVWQDDDNHDGKRPETLKVTLVKTVGETETETEYTLSAADSWSLELKDLPKYEGGKEVSYRWTEKTVPDGYEKVSEVLSGSVTTITNRHNNEKTEAAVKKEWEDDSNRDNRRPASVTMILMKNNVATETKVVLDESNHWKDLVTGLDKYENQGDEIVYSFMEEAVENYSISGFTIEKTEEGTLTTIKNKYTPGRFCLTILKVWEDGNDQDGVRPQSISVQLLANGEPAAYGDGKPVGEVELKAADNWTGMVTSLPIMANGKNITYTWKEISVPDGYTAEAAEVSANSDTTRIGRFVNTMTPEETSISVKKEWADKENQDGVRPKTVTVELMANGIPVKEAVLREESGWTYTFEHLAKKAKGTEITYTVREINVDSHYTASEPAGNAKDGFVITNTHETNTVDVPVRKIWADAENQDGTRPNSITVRLLADGIEVDSHILTEAEKWEYTFLDLPKYDGGNEISYTITEDEVRGYSTAVNGFTITNTHDSETVTAEIRKSWEDQENLYGLRPASITVLLKADGEIIGSETLTAANGWAARRTDLPARKNGEPVAYTWEEINVPEGYGEPVYTTEGAVTTVINTLIAETTEATVQKIWVHNGNVNVPTELKVTLSGSDGFSKEFTLTAENGWKVTETNLPAHDAEGKLIAYSWSEEDTEGYSLTESSTNGTVTTLVNTYGTDTSMIVRKSWADGNENHAEDSVTVVLKKNGVDYQSYTLNAENEWTVTAENLPLTEEGRAIAYSWSEVQVAGYRSSITVEGNVTIITNTKIPQGTGEFSAGKTWENGTGTASLTLTGKTRNDDGSLETVFSKTQTVTGDAQASWSDAPLFTEDGRPIIYSLTEDGVGTDGTIGEYISSITGDEEKGYNVVNHGKPEAQIIEKEVVKTVTVTVDKIVETTSAAVVKVWEDENNAYSTRPAQLEVTLSTGDTYELNESNNWTQIVSGLPVKDEEGNTIEYTWSEPSVEGYTSRKSVTGNVTVFTNTYTPEPVPEEPPKITVYVKKVWDDDDNAYGKRPESLTVTLSTGETYTLNEANGWSEKAEDLPAMDEEGNEITYTWTEQDVSGSGYKLVDTTVIGTTTVFTNRYRPEPVPEEPETVTVGVKKVWDDDQNANRMRPANLTVTLSNGTNYTLNAGNNWSMTVENLPARDENGNEITYSWTEENINGYTLTDTTVIGNTTVFTNHYRVAKEAPKTSASVIKIWDDENNLYQSRPANIRVTLSNGQSYTLNEENNWSLTVEDLPATDANGNAIAYTWTEQNVPGYTISGETVTGNTTVITNRYRPEEETEDEVPKTSATVVKIWDDNDNEYHLRPNHLRVTLSNGTSYDLNAGNNWSVTVEDLPAERNGQPIVYTWSEQSVPGYKLVGTTVAGNTTVFTNRYREVVVPSNDPNGNKKTGTPATFIDDYETPLGVGVTINHVGDCFE